jgi:cell division protein FtsW (lipid II flippase)
LAVAGLLSFVAWIVVMVHAYRAEHRWWMVCILLFHLLGIAYVLIHVEGKRRWFKFATLLAQTAPYAVALATVWRFFAFLR